MVKKKDFHTYLRYGISFHQEEGSTTVEEPQDQRGTKQAHLETVDAWGSCSKLKSVTTLTPRQVGKSSLLLRYTTNEFQDTFLSSIGVDYVRRCCSALTPQKDKVISVNGKEENCQIVCLDRFVLRILIFSVGHRFLVLGVRRSYISKAGQERFRTITSSYYRGAHGICLTFDLTEPTTFKGVGKWVAEIDLYAEDHVEVILVGNKADRSEIKVTKDVINELLSQHPSIKYFETSAKSNTGISEAFEALVTVVVKSWEENTWNK